MATTTNGAFIISRSLYDSEIWVMKPSEWLKIWIYLLGKVNWQDNGLFKRGEQLFKYDYITRDCRVSYDTVRRCIEHLQEANQISTKRTTRGLIISVNNYDQYQNFDNYSQSKANQKPIKSQSSTHSIIEEGNKERKKEESITCLQDGYVSDSLERLIGNWNNEIPKCKKCRGPTGDLREVWKKIRKKYSTHEEYAEAMKIAVQNYGEDIKGRDPDHRYYLHRFSLYDFLKQENGFTKFLNQ